MAAPLTLETMRALPKVLLHDHLDGGLRPATLIELAAEIGWALPATDPDDLQQWFTSAAASSDIVTYLSAFEHTVAVLQSAGALTRVAAEAVADLHADGVVYAELRFAPELHEARGLTMGEAVAAVARGLEAGERATGGAITVNLILCAMRTGDRSAEVAQLTERIRFREPKVVGFDLAGAEAGYPASAHAEATEVIRRNLINLTIHASEPPDVELIADALGQGARRIGHGVRLASGMLLTPDGSALVSQVARYVLDQRIHLEMAPTCNVQIGAVPVLGAHPIGPLLRLGFDVGVNTDNRLVSGVTLSGELLAVANAFRLSWAEVEQLVVNAAGAAFAPWEARQRLIAGVIRPAFARVAA